MADHTHGPKHYKKIWLYLFILFLISFGGPFLEIRWLTMMTAFGVAIWKAYLVAANFMHLNIEKRYVLYIMGGMLLFMGLFFAGTSPDVLKHEGQNWENVAAKQEVERAMKQIEEQAQHGEEAH